MNYNFEMGDEAIALSSATAPNQPRKKGRSYTVTGIFYCSTTGEQMINIDYCKSNSRTIACGCGKRHQTGDNLAYTYSNRFIKPENLEALRDESVEKEDFETASVCRDILDKIAPAGE